MADSAFASVLQNLSRLLVDEVNLLSGVEDKIRSLNNEFKFISVFLKSSEGKRSSDVVKEVVNQIRDVAHKVEDVVDTYVAKATIQRSRNLLNKLVHYKSHVKMLHDVLGNIAVGLLLSLLKCLLSTSDYNDLFMKRDGGVIVSENEEEMKEKVKKSLRGKKYLVVLDDIWKTEVWDEVQGAFPDNDDNKGSKILITSRIKEVASYAGTVPPYYLPFLSQKESQELFFKKVFHGEDCPSNLIDLGESIVEGCGGLPLAIVVVAGLAKRNKSQKEWLNIKDHTNWRLAQEDNNKVMEILKLSYDNLPQRLQSCFLYFGIYPEDYEIPVRQLIRLWMAEGFIQPPETGTSNPPEPEDIGDYYLNELADRSLVQVTSQRSDGGVKTCQIHDLLRELCISESRANKFMQVCTKLDVDMCNPRRMSFQYKTGIFLPSKYSQSHTRSLFLFGERIYLDSKCCKGIMKSFKLARVLHLNKACLDLPPGDLKTMIHLRYLKIETLPGTNILASICNLWNLETLHFICEKIGTLPPGIWRLKRLRHFYLRVKAILRMSKGVDSEIVQNLQTLSEVSLKPQIVSMLNNGCFPNLTKLGFWFIPGGRRIDETLSKMHGTTDPSLSSLSLHHLSKLHNLKIRGISGRFNASVIDSIFFPPNLTKITLKNFIGLDSKILGRLASLRILKLSTGSASLDCAYGEFPQLQVLEMYSVQVLKWRLEKGAMPCLSHLLIRHCLLSKDLPEQLWSLTTLREVHVIVDFSESGVSLYQSLEDVKPNNGCKIILSPFD